jgi:hypothetical protein
MFIAETSNYRRPHMAQLAISHITGANAPRAAIRLTVSQVDPGEYPHETALAETLLDSASIARSFHFLIVAA